MLDLRDLGPEGVERPCHASLAGELIPLDNFLGKTYVISVNS